MQSWQLRIKNENAINDLENENKKIRDKIKSEMKNDVAVAIKNLILLP